MKLHQKNHLHEVQVVTHSVTSLSPTDQLVKVVLLKKPGMLGMLKKAQETLNKYVPSYMGLGARFTGLQGCHNSAIVQTERRPCPM